MWFRLTERDRLLVFLLAEHQVLTTDQIAQVAFGSLRRAQDRLVRLRVIDVLARFRFSSPGAGPAPPTTPSDTPAPGSSPPTGRSRRRGRRRTSSAWNG